MAGLSGTWFPGLCRTYISILIIMNREFLIAFKKVMRDQFVEKNRVEIDGLGFFEVVHHEQYEETFENGRVVMMPPQDVLEFKSNIRISYDN